MFSDFESAMDPSRNHRRYRLNIEKMSPPLIPFMPLVLKGYNKWLILNQFL